jgi:hypothetical protein
MSGSRRRVAARLLLLVGTAGIAGGMFHQPDRVWAGILIASYALVTAGLGGVFFLALNRASGATWAVSFRRIPEAFAAAAPPAWLPCSCCGRPSTRGWPTPVTSPGSRASG